MIFISRVFIKNKTSYSHRICSIQKKKRSCLHVYSSLEKRKPGRSIKNHRQQRWVIFFFSSNFVPSSLRVDYRIESGELCARPAVYYDVDLMLWAHKHLFSYCIAENDPTFSHLLIISIYVYRHHTHCSAVN